MNKVYAGLQIIAKYNEDFEICAMQDEIFAGLGVEMSEEDKTKMQELDWRWEDNTWTCFT